MSSRLTTSGIGVPTGAILPFAGGTLAAGYLPCDGAAVSRTTYAALFGVIGTIWGAGDGSTTFNVPDLRGRVPVGVGAGPGLTPRTLGSMGGEESHALSAAEGAAHSHSVSDPGHSHGVSDPGHMHLVNWQFFQAATGGGTTRREVSGPGGGILASTAASGVSIAAAAAGISTTGSAGSGTPHNTMQPFAVMQMGIKT